MFAGGIAYYFAKKDINARRDEAHRRRLAHTPSASSNEAGQSYVSEIVGGAPDYTKQKYRIATGQATEGRDRYGLQLLVRVC